MFYKTEIGGWVFVNNLSLYNYLYFSVKEFRFREMKPIEQPLSSCWMYFGNFYGGKNSIYMKEKIFNYHSCPNQIFQAKSRQMHKLIYEKTSTKPCLISLTSLPPLPIFWETIFINFFLAVLSSSMSQLWSVKGIIFVCFTFL